LVVFVVENGKISSAASFTAPQWEEAGRLTVRGMRDFERGNRQGYPGNERIVGSAGSDVTQIAVFAGADGKLIIEPIYPLRGKIPLTSGAAKNPYPPSGAAMI